MHPTTTFTLNGQIARLAVDPAMPLVLALRDHAGLTGTKYCCLQGACGACTVWLDGAPLRACTLPLSGVAHRTVVTIEGLQGADAVALRQAWVARNVPQCGWCQSGQLMHAAALLPGWRLQPPDRGAVRDAMGAVACRCGTGQRVVDAVVAVLGLPAPA